MISFIPESIISTSVNDDLVLEIEHQLAEFMVEANVDDEPLIAASPATISRAAAIMRDFSARHHLYDYAFGEDGSIGIHCQHGERTEFIDLLSDGRIRYSLRDGNTIEQRVLSSEEAAAFVSIRASTLRNASLFISSYDTSKTSYSSTIYEQSDGVAVCFTGRIGEPIMLRP
jgi:hypothetical protein